MKRFNSFLAAFCISLLMAVTAFAQTPDTSTFEKKARWKIGRIRDNTIRAITPTDFRNALNSIANLAVTRTPYVSIAQLRAGQADTAKAVYITDVGKEGLFVYQSASTAADDSSIVIRNVNRRYVRDFKGPVKAEWFGVTGTNNAADSLKFLGILAKGYRNIELGEGVFRIGVTISQSNVRITGVKPQYDGSNLTGGTIISGRIIITGNNNQISRVGITNTTSDGFLIRNNASYNSIDNCLIKVFNHGVLVEQYGGTARGNKITSCTAYGGIHGFVSKSANLRFENCISTGASQDGFALVSDNITGNDKPSICVNNQVINCQALNTNIGYNLYSRDYSSTTNAAGIELQDVTISGSLADSLISYGISVGDAQTPGAGQTYNKVRQISLFGNTIKNVGPWSIQFARCFSVVAGNNILNKAMNRTTDAERVMTAPNPASTGSFGNLSYNSVLTVNSTTPSVLNGETFFETANTASTVIVNFTGGRIGQVIYVQIKDAFTTIINGANITLNSYIRGVGSTIALRLNSAFVWEEVLSVKQNEKQDWPYSATNTFDYRNGPVMFSNLTGDVTQLNFANMPIGKEFVLVLTATGATRTLTGWDSRIIWLNSRVPRKVTTGAFLAFRFYYDGTNIRNISRQGEEYVNSASWNPGAIAAGSQATTTVTVTGADLLDLASASFSNDLQGLIITAYVSAPGVATVSLFNPTGAPVTPAAGTVLTSVRPK